ncbi:hypothetical protein CANCADRAFT_148426 [Tortispora caseinolytica NRRL Y-17796]|uniref:PUM-HD domain-containing protein n=1 Tax=Tortispora caseinolytica NRRL Y-17796 TaxID=767744 RepID=A0A1E4TBB7_9ASCO|nr:hypothetical protein CANCADRAFT_148426 [Tortispora caseinolytica NRRL Y-17796]
MTMKRKSGSNSADKKAEFQSNKKSKTGFLESESESESEEVNDLALEENEDDISESSFQGFDETEDDGNSEVDEYDDSKPQGAHTAQRTLLKERKISRQHGKTIQHIKSLWEKLRQKKNISSKERRELVDKIWSESNSIVEDLVLKHDSSRVVQSLLKYGDANIRRDIALQLKGSYLDLAKSSYGKYLLVKLLHYGSKETRKDIVGALHGHYRKLMKHREGVYVIEDIYREYSTVEQKRQIIREFYGSEFAVFKDAGKSKTLAEIVAGSPDKRKIVMYNLKQAISSAVSKGSSGFNIIHAAMLDYISVSNEEETREFIDLVGEQIPELVHTTEGATVASLMIAKGTAKERKTMIKSLKQFAVELIKDSPGNVVLIALFSCVDDTVLIGKSFVGEYRPQIVDLLAHTHARIPFMTLLAGRKTRYLDSAALNILKQVDEAKVNTSKKEDSARDEEVLAHFSPLLISAVSSSARTLLDSTSGTDSLTQILFNAPGDISAAVDAVAGIFEDAKARDELLSKSYVGKALRNLINDGTWSHQEKCIVKNDKRTGFKEAITPIVLNDIESWALGDGSFVVQTVLENSSGADKEKLKAAIAKLKPKLELKQETNKGCKLLIQAISK